MCNCNCNCNCTLYIFFLFISSLLILLIIFLKNWNRTSNSIFNSIQCQLQLQISILIKFVSHIIFFCCSRRIFEFFIHFTPSNPFPPIFCFFFQKINLLSFFSDFLLFILNSIQSRPFQIIFLSIFSFYLNEYSFHPNFLRPFIFPF